MLQKSQTKKFNQVKYALLIPLIALFLYSFNIKEVFIETNQFQINTEKPNFILPIEKENIISISSGFGMRTNPITKENKFHKGIYFKVYKDMDVYSAAVGVVLNTGFNTNDGNFIEIEHKDNYITKYHHLGNIQVEKGENVAIGEIIGIVGSTGKSTVAH